MYFKVIGIINTPLSTFKNVLVISIIQEQEVISKPRIVYTCLREQMNSPQAQSHIDATVHQSEEREQSNSN
jgi:ABC-type lipoprotein release transport system permease subunit